MMLIISWALVNIIFTAQVRVIMTINPLIPQMKVMTIYYGAFNLAICRASSRDFHWDLCIILDLVLVSKMITEPWGCWYKWLVISLSCTFWLLQRLNFSQKYQQFEVGMPHKTPGCFVSPISESHVWSSMQHGGVFKDFCSVLYHIPIVSLEKLTFDFHLTLQQESWSCFQFLRTLVKPLLEFVKGPLIIVLHSLPLLMLHLLLLAAKSHKEA
jgi:hypothetical protein